MNLFVWSWGQTILLSKNPLVIRLCYTKRKYMKQYIDSILDPEITLKKGKERKGILLNERNSFECFQGYFYVSL